jgi:phosphoribosylaminoimidazolecarboxamide formyltransferase / IMP cyclohydrolase
MITPKNLPAPSLVAIKRALISVSDKTGVVEFAKELARRGVMIISTGGTAKAIAAAGIAVTSVEDVTGLPEMLDGRVKTLHPVIHGGLLAIRDDAEHAAALRRNRIEPIDLVCINLYPFEETVARPGVTLAEAIENIDIGGPSMLRSGAKNSAYVTVATHSDHYARILQEMDRTGGCTTPGLRAELAREVFALTARYDGAIASYLSKHAATPAAPSIDQAAHIFPDTINLTLTKHASLRQGENSHQQAAVYRIQSSSLPGLLADHAGTAGLIGPHVTQHHGKEMGYNNLADAAAAWDLALELAAQAARSNVQSSSTACAIIKHANPCGCSVAGSAKVAIDRAIAGDPTAAFGGILACSSVITADAAQRLSGKDTFLEVIIAPGYEPAALATLKAKSANVRLLEVTVAANASNANPSASLMLKTLPGSGALIQHRDLLAPASTTWRHVAGPAPSPSTLRSAELIEIMVRSMSSNAIAIGGLDETTGASSIRLFGGGVGQVDRVTACHLAAAKAKQFAGELLASGQAIALSDAFFPFPDGPQILIDAGVKTIVHPGGSMRDDQTIELCNTKGITCLLTGVRRFRH